MDYLLELTTEQLELLLSECSNDLNKYKSKLIALIIEKEAVKRKIRQLEEEKDVLEMVKSGSDFNEHLVYPKTSTMNTLQKRYLQVMQNEVRKE